MNINFKFIILLAIPLLSFETRAYDYQYWISGKNWRDYWKAVNSSKNEHEDYSATSSSWREAFKQARANNHHFFTYRSKSYNSFRGSEWRKITINLGMNSKVKQIPSKYISSALKGTAFKLSRSTYVQTHPEIYKFNFDSLNSSNRKRRTLALFRYLLDAKKKKRGQKFDKDKIQFKLYSECGQNYEDCQERLILKSIYKPSIIESDFIIGEADHLDAGEIIFNDISSAKYISGRSTFVKYLLDSIVHSTEPTLRTKTNVLLNENYNSCLYKNTFKNTSLTYFVDNYHSNRNSANPFCIYLKLMRKVNR